jgi:YfiH family protein
MIAWIERKGLVLGTFPALEAVAPGFAVRFSTRTGGVSLPPRDSLNLGSHVGDRYKDVLENRRRLRDALDLRPGSIAMGGQVHGTEIAIVSRGGILKSTDGFITSRKGLALAINTADCFPVIIHSPSERVVAALHVGRAGAADGIIEKAFEILHERFRIDTDNTVAVCGPGICARCYQVGYEIVRSFPKSVCKMRSGVWHLDLRSFIRSELMRAGIRPSNWFDSGLCTACDAERFFSYRRDGDKTGRQWTLAYMTER